MTEHRPTPGLPGSTSPVLHLVRMNKPVALGLDHLNSASDSSTPQMCRCGQVTKTMRKMKSPTPWGLYEASII